MPSKEKTWQVRAFGKSAHLVRETCSPGDAGNAPYIGLEHIEEGTLRLSRYGKASDVSSIKSMFKKGDILFGKLRPYFRKVVRAPFDGVCSTDIWVVRAEKGIDQKFLYYWMASQEFVDIANQGSEGTKMPRAKWDFVSRIEAEVPSIPEQCAIAHILGSLDEKIELNRKMNKTLESMALAIFKSWFVDFDPLRAIAEGRKPEGMDAETAALFPKEFVDSELGEIPKGWEVSLVDDVAGCVKGKSYKSEDLQDSKTALVTLKSFARGGGYRSDGLKAYSGGYKAEQVVRPGELVIACTDVTQAAEVIGRPALVQSTNQFTTLVASLDVLIVRPRTASISVPFLYCLFRTDEFANHTYAHSTGTTVLHLSREAVPTFRFAIPPLDLRKAFTSMALPIFERIDTIERESSTLTALRNALLPKLLSGEIRVKDA